MRLTYREKKLTFIAIAVSVILSLYVLAVKPTRQHIDTLNRVIPEKRDILAKLTEKAGQYRTLTNKLDTMHKNIASQEPGFAVMPFLESLIARQQLETSPMSQQVYPVGDQYTETTVTADFDSISLPQLVSFLQQIKAAPAPLTIKNITIGQRAPGDNLLRSKLQISHLNSRLIQ
jgi:type II secretory pathway component PulM